MANLRTLILNPGSSSLKWELFASLDEVQTSTAGEVSLSEIPRDLPQLIATLNPGTCIIRVVHGGEKFHRPILLSLSIVKDLEQLVELAPLHNRVSVDCASWLLGSHPQLATIAVFDTEFFHDLPESARIYGLPCSVTQELGIRRYGFHGFAHAAMWNEFQRLLSGNIKSSFPARVITIQLGSGCSMAAIDSGAPLDTTMGFTPNEGLLMATRSGDIDPGLITWLQREKSWSPQDIDRILNEQSGWLGVSGESKDMGKLLASQSREAELAIDLFCLRIRKNIGAYFVVLGGLDGIVLSGGIAENSTPLCRRLLSQLQQLGIELENSSNQNLKKLEDEPRCLSSKKSKVSCWVVPNNESVEMVRSVVKSGLLEKM